MNANPIPTVLPSCRRAMLALVLTAMGLPSVSAADTDRSPWMPSRAFVQLGAAEHANAAVAGAIWDWRWSREVGWGRLTGYWDVLVGRWASERTDGDSNAHALVTQLGFTPVVRLYPGHTEAGWYIEGGIGANLLLPVYRTKDKRFSTRFNFGDHFAVGLTFGERAEHDLSVRIQHFSNAGIRKPNPGENFLQLRYSRRF